MTVKGRIDMRDEEDGKIISDSFYLPSDKDSQIKPSKLFIRIKNSEDEPINSIKKTCS